ncbi:MAG: TAXI family TRAP transporter solute-binding subunit [Pseudomonadota bacterium]|nr:TAXI family TRAP transporter solute-binding subunit [Pseudomonadota bacterium]
MTFKRALYAAAGSLFLAGAAMAQPVTIASNPPGTDSNTVSAGIANYLSGQGMQAVVRPYAGTGVYGPLITTPEVSMGLLTGADAFMQYSGADDREPLTTLRALFRAFPLPYGYFVRCNSEITNISGLAGKRVAVDIQANASLGPINRAILASSGLGEDDLEFVTVGNLPSGIQGVVDGNLDAMSVAAGIARMQEANATTPGGICYLELDGENATQAELEKSVFGLTTYTIEPGPVFPEITDPVKIASLDFFMTADASMSDDQAYAVVKAMHENWAALQEDYPTLRKAPLDGLASATNGVPFHPGAIKYFEEVGLWSEDNATRDAGLME